MSDYNLGTASGRIVVDGSEAQRGFDVAGAAGTAFFKVIQDKIDSIQRLGRQLTAVGVAGVAGFGLAVNTASKFEKQMSAVQAVSGATGKSFDALREKALQIGADTQYSASESALALEELVKAGLSVEEVLGGAADATTALAAAGGTSLPDAATIASNAMNQFNLSGKEVVGVADLLAGAANTSAADVSTLGQSLSQVGAVANLAGLSLEDTVIALGELADRGIQGSDAGTSLKTMLLNLIPSTDQQIAKFQELGLMTYKADKAMRVLNAKGIHPASNSLNDAKKAVSEYLVETKGLKEGTTKLTTETEKFIQKNGVMNNAFFDSQGNVKSLRGIQDALAKSTEYLSDGTTKMTREEKLKNIEILFGTDAMRAAGIAALSGADGYDEFKKSMKGTSAAEVAKQRMDNLDGAVEQLSGAFETLQIKIAGPLLKPLAKLVNMLADVVSAIGKAPKPVLMAVTVLGALASAMALFLGVGLLMLPVILGIVANMAGMFIVRQLVGPFFAFGKALLFQRSASAATAAANTALSSSIFRLGIMAKVTTGIIKLMSVAVRILSFAFSGPGLIIIGLIALLVILYKKNEAFRNMVNRVAAAIRGALVSAFNQAKVVLGQFLDFMGKLADVFQAKVLPVIRDVGEMLVGKLLKGAQQLGKQIRDQIVPAFSEMSDTVSDVAQSPFGQKMAEWAAKAREFAAVIIPFLAKMQLYFVGKILPVLVRIVGFFAGVFIDTVVSAISGVIQTISGLIKVISGVIKIIKGVFSGDWAMVWEGMKQVVVGAFTAIVGLVKTYFAVGILKVFGLGLTLLKGLVKAGFTGLKSLFMLGVNGLWAAFKALPGLLVAVIRLWIRLQLAIIRAGFQFVVAVIRGAITGWVNAVRTGVGLIPKVIRGIIGAVRGAVSAAFGFVVGMLKGYVKAWGAAIRGAASVIKGAMGNIKGAITGAVSGFRTLLVNSGKALVEGLADGIRAVADLPKKAMGKVAGGIKNLLPGSPIKEGPLKSWSYGGAGKRLVGLLADGIEKDSDLAAKAMSKVANAIADPTTNLKMTVDTSAADIVQKMKDMNVDAGTLTSTLSGRPDPSHPALSSDYKMNPSAVAQKQTSIENLKLQGELDLRNGKPYIKATAAEITDSESEHQDTLNGQGGPTNAF